MDLSQRSLRLFTIITASLPQSVHILVVKEMVFDLEAFLVWGDKSRGEERGCTRERPWPSEDEVLTAQDGGQLPLSSGERGNGLAGPRRAQGSRRGAGPACGPGGQGPAGLRERSRETVRRGWVIPELHRLLKAAPRCLIRGSHHLGLLSGLCRVPASWWPWPVWPSGPSLPTSSGRSRVLGARRIWVWISVLQLKASATLVPFSKLSEFSLFTRKRRAAPRNRGRWM